MNNETINKKSHTKYLGMIVDNNLTWTQHILIMSILNYPKVWTFHVNFSI